VLLMVVVVVVVLMKMAIMISHTLRLLTMLRRRSCRT
jgi:hypothetical protein